MAWQSKRWWDAAFGAATAVSLLLVALNAQVPADWALVLVGLALVLLGYAVLARGAGFEESAARGYGFAVAGGLGLALAVAGSPVTAFLQAVAYPLVWVMAVRVRQAVLSSALLALGTCAGTVVRSAPDWGVGLAGGAINGGLSFVFALALGMWITRMTAYGRERARLLDELVEAQEQLAALNAERGAVAERERLARDIHDTLAQTLAGLVLLSERAGALAAAGETERVAGAVRDIEDVARAALGETRALVAQIAAVPGDRALGDALRRLCDRFRAETGLEIELTLDETLPALDRETQVIVLRLVQEGLANVRKHARARSVRIRVDAGPDAAEHAGTASPEHAGATGERARERDLVRVRIADDGRGFDPDAAHTGFGIDGMRERVALAGGTIAFLTAPDTGTAIAIELPVRSERAA